MGLAKKLKEALGSPPKERKAKDGSVSIVVPLPPKEEEDSTAQKNAQAKMEIELFQKKIMKKINDDPEMAKKAAMIISDMLKDSKK